jgi:hypothetical protein
MRCAHCGKLIIDQALFCPHCLEEDINAYEDPSVLDPMDITCSDTYCPNCHVFADTGDYESGKCLRCGWREGMPLTEPDDRPSPDDEVREAYLREWKERAYPKER